MSSAYQPETDGQAESFCKEENDDCLQGMDGWQRSVVLQTFCNFFGG
jgi:hypothetical protein